MNKVIDLSEKQQLAYMPQAKSDDHATPDRVYEEIQEKWGVKRKFLFDPCPIFTTDPSFDGLKIRWRKYNFVNPPYSDLVDWVVKAVQESSMGRTSFMLLPSSKTDQAWFHAHIKKRMTLQNVLWFRGRLKFKNDKFGATQPHFVVRIQAR